MLMGQQHSPATPAPTAAPKMADCPKPTAATNALWEADATTITASVKTGVASATVGDSGTPFYVQTETQLKGAQMGGGCKCGTAVCTIGRMCLYAKSMCFLPPCPYDSDGAKVVPDLYTAGCWCAEESLFKTVDIGIKQTTVDSQEVPLIPGEGFELPGMSLICKPKQKCSGDSGMLKCTD